MDDALCSSQELQAVMEQNNGNACAHLPCVSSSFTPINHQPTQLLTPEPSAAASAQQEQNTQSAFGHRRRRRNPAVAHYLGLGSTFEPTYLERYVPLPAPSASPLAKPVRKRQRLGGGEGIRNDTDAYAEGRDALNRPLVSESLRIKKAPSRSTAPQSKNNACLLQQPQSTDYAYCHTPFADDNIVTSSSPVYFQDVSIEARANFPGTSSVQTTSRNSMRLLPTSDVRFDFGNDSESVAFEDADNDPHNQMNTDKNVNDDDFDFDITDDELLTLTSEVDGLIFDAPRDASSSRKTPHCKDADETRCVQDTLQTELQEVIKMNSSQRSSKKFISPVTLTTRLLAATGDEGSTKVRKPIVRSPFPGSVRDRSPIIGLSSNTLLRTCFRIGEAINQSCQAAKSGKHMIIELYARVLASERTDTGQHFTLCDLFHAKPPYVKGMYDAAIWKAVRLFEYDSRRLLQQGRICRCIGTMKRDGKERTMTIHNIWEATWEDVEWVEGIVSS